MGLSVKHLLVGLPLMVNTLNTFLFLFSNKVLDFRGGIKKNACQNSKQANP